MEPERRLPPTIRQAVDRLDDLVEKFEQHPEPAVRERAGELLRCVDVIHRAGLRRLAALLESAGLTPRALDDPTIRLLFDLYDLEEGGERARVEAVLAPVRPSIEAHGGHLEVVDAQGGIVQVRLSDTGGSCQMSGATMRHLVEQTLAEALPDFIRLEVLESIPTPDQGPPKGFVPLSSLKVPKRPRVAWQVAVRLEEVPADGIRGLDVAGERVLVAHLGGEVYAYRNACPGTPLPLHGGQVEGDALRCPWHGCLFDLRGGKRRGADGPHLAVLPVAIEAGQVRIGVPVGAGR